MPANARSEGWRHDIARLGYPSSGCSVRWDDSPGVFEHLFEDEVQLCIWNRTADEILGAYLERSFRLGGWERRMEVPVMELGLDEAAQRLLAGFEEGLGRIRLTTELLGLIDLLVTLSDAQRIGVRMAATQSRSCPRFHTDAVALRLLCTWIGQGTEWLVREDVAAEAVASVSGRSSMARSARPGASVRRMGTFAVGVFKGERWPGNHGRGAVYRSPQPAHWRVWVSLDAL